MRPPIFHIGYMKTATTWLQKVYFPSVNNAIYLGRDHVHDVFLGNDLFDTSPEELHSFYKKYENETKRLIFSSERLIGPVSLGYRDGSYIKSNADRIAAVFRDAEIVLFIRNQESMIASCYMQYVRNGGNFSINKYLYTDERSFFSFKYLEYHKIIEYYKSLFNKVHVFFYEDFANNPSDFVSMFSQTLGLDHSLDTTVLTKRENPSIKTWLLPLFKFLNLFSDGNGASKYQVCSIKAMRYWKNRLYHILARNSFFTAPSNPKKLLGKRNIHFIREYYADSNRILLEKHGLIFIERHNYPL